MTWIRGPVWDSCWLLSGLPIGAALTVAALRIPAGVLIFWIILAIQTGHTLAPMMASWSNRGYRDMMRRRRVKYIVLPLAVLSASAIAGYVGGLSLPGIVFDPNRFAIAEGPQSLADLKNPFLAMVLAYALWNGWHFGRQNFGVLSLYRRHGPGRRTDLIFACGAAWLTMALPFIPSLAHGLHNLTGLPAHPHPFLDYFNPGYCALAGAAAAYMLMMEVRRGPVSLPRFVLILTQCSGLALVWHWGLWGMAIVAINHWLTSIGLASLISNKRAPGVSAWRICFWGAVIFAALFINPFDVGVMSWQMFSAPTYILHFTVIAVGLRLGIGFVHFLYDRWLYNFGDPPVRATIGRDIFSLM